MFHSGALTYCFWTTDPISLSKGLGNKSRGSWDHLLFHSQHLRAPGIQNMGIPTWICMILFIIFLPSFEGLSCLCLHSASRNQKPKIVTKSTRVWKSISREKSSITQAHGKQWNFSSSHKWDYWQKEFRPISMIHDLSRILLPHRMLRETHAVGITGGIFPLQREAEVRDGAMHATWCDWRETESLFRELVHCHSSNFSL